MWRAWILVCLFGIGVPLVAAGDPSAPNENAQHRSAQPTLENADQIPDLKPIHPSTPASATTDSVIQLVAAKEPVTEAPTRASIKEKQADVASQLRVAMLQEEQKRESEPDGDATPQRPANKDSKVDLLKQIDVVVQQQKSTTTVLADLDESKADLEAALAKLADGRLETDPPYSILMLDQVRDKRRDLKTRRETSDSSLLAARQAVERAASGVDERGQAMRQLKERIGGTGETPELEVANLELKLAEEMLVLRRQELQIAQTNQDVQSLQTSVNEREAEIIGSLVTFSRDTLLEKLAEIDAREASLKRRANSLQSDLRFAERRWTTARSEVDATPDPGPELRARVDAEKTAEQATVAEIDIVNERLGRLPQTRAAWKRRFDVATDQATNENRRTWLAETIEFQDQLRRERRADELKLDELRVNNATITNRLEELNGDNPELRRWLQKKQEAIGKQIEVFGSSLIAIDSVSRTMQRLRLQIEGEGRSTGEVAADLWASVKGVWNQELADVDGTSVTVGKVISAVLLVFFGFFAARWLSGILGRRLPGMGVDEAAVHAIESLSFYVLLVTFALTALRYVSVPLTVFTFLGGAIAIGVGFGSQNVVNNFISGLILLAERPIKAGDLIKLGETYGNVTKIGARSTQIRTGENQDIIVPNSKFLENEVTNLTRRDDRLRTSISVGVAYGSPLELVMELLLKVAVEDPSVNDRPKPMVWFNDFADNSLVFQVHFWINARTVSQMKSIETNVRLAIDKAFREHDIVIAFPQRDLHIQSPRPIDFRLVRDDGQDSDGLDDGEIRAAG